MALRPLVFFGYVQSLLGELGQLTEGGHELDVCYVPSRAGHLCCKPFDPVRIKMLLIGITDNRDEVTCCDNPNW